jgi:hypothetical protein
MDRRTFMQRAPLTAVGLRLAFGAGTLGIALTESGCNVFTDIENWVPVGEAAVNSILSVLTANGVVIAAPLQAIVSLVEAGFAALTAAIKEYQSTVPAPVGALAKIEEAFTAIVDNFRTFLTSLSVSGGLLAIIVGLAQIVFSTIAAFMNQLPAASSLRRTVVLGATFRVAGSTAVIVPRHRTRRAFKHDWNGVLATSPTVGVVCPASAYLNVSFWERL